MGTRTLDGAWGVVLSAAVLLSGCTMKRIENGVYHSPKGYRVTVPDGPWTLVADSQADLELQHRAGAAGMAVNAVCGGAVSRRTTEVLARQLLIGLRDRAVVAREPAEVAGQPAWRVVVEGRLADAETSVRIESVLLKNARCLYDFLYVASPAAFDEARPDFQRLLDSFRTE